MAVEAWILVGKPTLDDTAEAFKKFQDMCPEECRTPKPSEFVHDWVKAQTVCYTKRSASPLARRHSVDDDVARACARQVKAGRVAEGWQK